VSSPARPPSVRPADGGAAARQLEREDKHAEAAQYDFFPVTFILPNEYHMFVEDFKRAPDATWIAKPIGRAQGKGIFLFNDLGSLKEWKRAYDARGAPASQSKKEVEQEVEVYIAQRYIDRPYLIGGKKFDLRLYVLVTSYSPLRVWMYRAGFARFSNHRFSMQRGDISNAYVHLTNVAIQKTAAGYDREQGCKWDLRAMKLFMASKHGVLSPTAPPIVACKDPVLGGNPLPPAPRAVTHARGDSPRR